MAPLTGGNAFATAMGASDSGAAYRRAWRVLHACDRIREVLPLVEGQLAAGMRPAVVTLDGYGPVLQARGFPERAANSTLMSAWGDVRSWRKSLLESGAESQVEIVHAHAFAPGMAAVRSCPTVVYDIHDFVEESAVASRQCDERSWLARSFRVAEQFVISRAAAVVVHSAAQRCGAEERGAPAEGTFLIPEPVDLEAVHILEPSWRGRYFRGQETSLLIFAADPDADALPVLLQAIALLPAELEVRVMIAGGAAPRIGTPMGRGVVPIAADDHLKCTAAADLVIAGSPASLLAAMVHSKAVLAADTAPNRNVTPDGRGCLWYRTGDGRDLAHRIAALGQNAALRAALAEAGRKFVEETRSPAAVGAAYDAAYRYAVAHRRTLSGSPPMALQPLNAAL